MNGIDDTPHRGQHDDFSCAKCKFYRQTGKMIVGALRFVVAEISSLTNAIERKVNQPAAIDEAQRHAD